MTDFLTKRLGTTVKLDLGDGYWVELRALAKGDLAACQSKMSQMRIVYDERTEKTTPSGDIDVAAYQEELVCRSIVAWNLDGPEGMLPHSPIEELRKSYRRLPGAVADKIYEECDKLNAAPTRDEDARFPGAGVSSDSGSEAPSAAAGNGGVPHGARALEGAGSLP